MLCVVRAVIIAFISQLCRIITVWMALSSKGNIYTSITAICSNMCWVALEYWIAYINSIVYLSKIKNDHSTNPFSDNNLSTLYFANRISIVWLRALRYFFQKLILFSNAFPSILNFLFFFFQYLFLVSRRTTIQMSFTWMRTSIHSIVKLATTFTESWCSSGKS